MLCPNSTSSCSKGSGATPLHSRYAASGNFLDGQNAIPFVSADETVLQLDGLDAEPAVAAALRVVHDANTALDGLLIVDEGLNQLHCLEVAQLGGLIPAQQLADMWRIGVECCELAGMRSGLSGLYKRQSL